MLNMSAEEEALDVIRALRCPACDKGDRIMMAFEEASFHIRCKRCDLGVSGTATALLGDREPTRDAILKWNRFVILVRNASEGQ